MELPYSSSSGHTLSRIYLAYNPNGQVMQGQQQQQQQKQQQQQQQQPHILTHHPQIMGMTVDPYRLKRAVDR